MRALVLFNHDKEVLCHPYGTERFCMCGRKTESGSKQEKNWVQRRTGEVKQGGERGGRKEGNESSCCLFPSGQGVIFPFSPSIPYRLISAFWCPLVQLLVNYHILSQAFVCKYRHAHA